jgi:hypothetical protein
LVHGQQVGDAPVDLAQEHSRSDVSAFPASPSVSPSPAVCSGAPSPSGSVLPPSLPAAPRLCGPPQRFDFGQDGLNDTARRQAGANAAAAEPPGISDSVFSAFLSASEEAFMPPAVNYALLTYSLSVVGYLSFDP